MKQYSDTISVELTFSQISVMTTRAVSLVDEIIANGYPLPILRDYVMLSKKLNDILKQNGLDHYTDEKFQLYEEFIKLNEIR